MLLIKSLTLGQLNVNFYNCIIDLMEIQWIAGHMIMKAVQIINFINVLFIIIQRYRMKSPWSGVKFRNVQNSIFNITPHMIIELYILIYI